MADITLLPQVFLGCNSGSGFISKFGSVYDGGSGWVAHIIKGGPGTGKSTFMKKIAAEATERGFSPIISPCTGDPDSLDAVIIPEISTVIMDGTAPHIVEGKNIGCVERIVNFGDAFDYRKLRRRRDDIIDINRRISENYRLVYRYTAAAAALKKSALVPLGACIDKGKAAAFCRNFARKHLPQTGNGRHRNITAFLDGLTCKGNIFFGDAPSRMASDITVIDDRYGAAADAVISGIAKAAGERGYDFILCPDPLLPDSCLRHIIIPQAGVAVVTGRRETVPGCKRQIHAKRFLNGEKINKELINFGYRTAAELEKSAAEVMKKCKSLHDELENRYCDAVDFAAINSLYDTVSADIFAERML